MSYADPGARAIIERAVIRMPYCPHAIAPERDRWPVVRPGSPVRLRRIAEQLARQFQRETRFDVPPFQAANPGDAAVVLLPSPSRLLVGARLIAGAVGVEAGEDGPRAMWVYVHPYERGRGLVDDAWPEIARLWPGIALEGPFTPAGERLRDRLQDQG